MINNLPTLVTVNVTEADISNGLRLYGDRCPIALAMRRALPMYPNLYTSYGAVFSGSSSSMAFCRFNGTDERFPLPDCVLAFMRTFDNNHPVEPFSFDIELSLADCL